MKLKGSYVLFAVVAFSSLALMFFAAKNELATGLDVAGQPACCTVQEYQYSHNGIWQGNAKTATVTCLPGEHKGSCCIRVLQPGFRNPLRLLGVRDGVCSVSRPELGYPMFVVS